MAAPLHPLLAPEVHRWLGGRALTPELEGLLEGLSVRLQVVDGVRAADSASELEAFFRLSGDLLLVLDGELRIRHLNTAFQALGWALEGSRGQPLLGLVAEADRATIGATLQSILATREQVPLEARMLDGKGGTRVVHWLFTTDDQGHRIFGVGRDVSERQALERRVSQADRLGAVGQLAAGVAHEVNTPLQFLGDNLTFVAETFGDVLPLLAAAARRAQLSPDLTEAAGQVDVDYVAEEVPRALQAMRDGLERVGSLVRSLKELAPSDGEALSPAEAVDLLPTLRATLAALASTELAGLTLRAELEPLPPVRCDPAGMAKVLSSLLSNAAHAIAARAGAQGVVTVRTRVEGQEAVLSVEDDGTGIAAAARSRIFEPFFTTREVGQGSGQSLAVARSLVERHQGTIGFATEEGVGTTFTVRLPLAEDELTEADLWG